MWQHTSTDQRCTETSSSSTNLRKNFNPYEILPPQRAPLNEPLIDLGTSDEATCITPNRFTDTAWNSIPANKSKGFDPIDLYQNMFVTPQLVNNYLPNENHIDFEEFFNKLESDKKYDWLNINREPLQQKGADEYIPITINKSYDCDNSRDINVLEVESIFDKTQYSAKDEYFSVERKCEYTTIEEDIIEEVILDKTLEKIKISELNKPKEVLKMLPTPKINLTKRSENINKSRNDTYERPKNIIYHTFNDKAINQELLTENIQKGSFFYDNFPIHNNYSSKNIPDAITHKHTYQDFKKRLFDDSNITFSQPNSERNSNTLLLLDLSAQNYLLSDNKVENNVKIPELINRKFAVRETPIRPGWLLENQQKTMPKDAKHLAKYSLNVDLNEQIHLTPGPTFDEKIIALPRILERLEEQKKTYEYTNNLQRRLILDEGAQRRAKIDSIGLKPVILKEDCNRDRLQSFKVGQMFGKFVKNGDDS